MRGAARARRADAAEQRGARARVNPFLRVDEPQVRASAHAHERPVATTRSGVFATLRQWKNEFR
jgi:hypothetical protein